MPLAQLCLKGSWATGNRVWEMGNTWIRIAIWVIALVAVSALGRILSPRGENETLDTTTIMPGNAKPEGKKRRER